MPLTLLRHATQKPPVGPLKIDWDHPLAQGLVGMIPAHEYGSASITEIVTQTQLSSVANTGWGSGYGVTGVAAIAQSGDFSVHAPRSLWLQTPITLVWRGANIGTPDTGGTMIFGVTYGNGQGAPYAGYQFVWASDVSHVVIEYNNGSYQNLVGAARALGPLWLAATFEANSQKIWCNDPSTPVATASVSMGSAISYIEPLLVFGAQPYDPRATQVIGEVGHIYNRVLTTAELAALKAEPYCMLQTRPLQHWGWAYSNQLVRPVSDTSNSGNWTQPDGSTTTNLFAQLNESPASDLNYARSPVRPSSSSYTARLGTYQQPVSGTITLHTRVSSTLGTGEVDYTVQLMQGATTIQTFVHNRVSVSTYTQFDDVVTNAITNWSVPFDVVVSMNASP